MDELKPLALLLIGGLSFRFALTLTGQAWAQTYQQTAAFLILPFVTYVITKTDATTSTSVPVDALTFNCL